MSAKSPKAPAAYSSEEQDRYRALLDRRGQQTRMIGQDLELSSEAFIMSDEVTGFRYRVAIQSGALVVVPL
jgi:hypothetical protein